MKKSITIFSMLKNYNQEVSNETKKIYKDVFVVSFSFLLLFLAFNSTFRLQSSIHTEANLGLWSKVFFSLGPQFERSEYVPYLFWPRFIVHPDLCCQYCQGKTYSEKVAVYASLICSCLLLAPTMISFMR